METPPFWSQACSGVSLEDSSTTRKWKSKTPLKTSDSTIISTSTKAIFMLDHFSRNHIHPKSIIFFHWRHFDNVYFRKCNIFFVIFFEPFLERKLHLIQNFHFIPSLLTEFADELSRARFVHRIDVSGAWVHCQFQKYHVDSSLFCSKRRIHNNQVCRFSPDTKIASIPVN